MMKIGAVLILMLPALMGCASELRVTDSDGVNALPGVPVQAPLLVAVETTSSYKPVGTPPAGCDLRLYCADRVTSQPKFLPLGKTYYIDFESAALAKSEFGLTFAESGALTGISLNSTPSLESFSGLLDTVLPFLAAPKAPPATNAAAVPGGACPMSPKEVFEKHCIAAGSNVTKVEEIVVERKTP